MYYINWKEKNYDKKSCLKRMLKMKLKKLFQIQKDSINKSEN